MTPHHPSEQYRPRAKRREKGENRPKDAEQRWQALRSRPLRGRGEAMAVALSVLRGARRHGSSGAVLLSGPPGIGKTSVLSAICQEAATAGLTVLRGKCDPIEQVCPGAPVIALLRSGRELVVGAEEYEHIARSVGEPLLLADRMASRLEAVARERPVLLALDDMQWADRTSMFVIRTLIPRLIGLPVVWAPAARGHVDASAWEDHGPIHVEHIRLGPLSDSVLAQIAQDRLGYAPDERILGYLAASGGNPFAAAQILDGFAHAAERGEPDAIPAQFAAAVAGRLAGLSHEARELVELAATAGRPLPLGDASALLSGNPATYLPDVIEAGLVLSGEHALTFQHDLVREAVHACIDSSRVRDLHRRLAEHYLAVGQPLVAASHARAAAVPGDLDSAVILLSAAETLADISADDAAELAELAFDTVFSLDAAPLDAVLSPATASTFAAAPPAKSEWLDLALRCLSVLCRIQHAVAAVAVADRILARIDDGDLIGRVETDAARALWLSGRISELRARTERVMRTDDMSPAVAVRLRAARALGDTRVLDSAVATREAEEVLQEARLTGDRETLALALEAAGQASRNDGRHHEALGYFRQLRSLTGLGHLADEVIELQFLDRYDHAQTLLDQARLEQDGAGNVLPALLAAQAWQDFNLGRLDEADAGCQTLFDLGPRRGNAVYALDAAIVRISSALMRGDTETAAAHLRLADELGGTDEDLREPGLTVMRGWLAAARGDLATSRDVLRPVLSGVVTKSCTYWPLWPCWMGLFFEIGFLADDDDFAATAEHVCELAASRNPGVASFEGVALCLRGRSKNDLEMIGRAAEVLTRSPRPLLRGFGAYCNGRALLAAGQREPGLAELDRAWDEYHSMDAGFYRATAEQLMRDAGVRLAKWSPGDAPPADGWASLTRAERRVAELIGAGYTNKAAAVELSVTVNTVGTHLRSVFAKLGVRSRVQLANALHNEHAN